MASKRLTNLQTEAILNPEDLSSQEKHYLETLDRRKAEEKYKTDSAKAKTSKEIQQRFVDERIPSSNMDWMNRHHPDITPHYEKYVRIQAEKLNKAAKYLSKEFGIDLHKEHPISVSGSGDVKITPTTSGINRGPNDQGFAGDARFNKRLNAKNAFNRKDLDQLGIASSWEYSAANFVTDRPDIKDPELRAKKKLKPLGPKVSNLGMLKLQQGDLNIDTLQMKMFIEQDLKNSGFDINTDQKAKLGAFLLDLENKEKVINAQKHGANWDLQTKFKHNNPKGSERFEQRFLESKNAIQRQNPEFTKLPSQSATTPKAMFKEVTKIGGKKLFREVVRKMGGSNNVIANISGDIIGTIMDGVTYAQTKDQKALTDLALSGGQALTSLGALGIAFLPIPGARVGSMALVKVGDNLASVERIYNLMGGTAQINQMLQKSPKAKLKAKI